MLKDALVFLYDQATKSTKPELVYSNARVKRYLLNGQIVDVPTVPTDRSHVVVTLQALIDLANRFKQAGMSPVAWYSWGAAPTVDLVLDDDAYRVNTVTLPLMPSDTYDTVHELAQGKRFELKPFVSLLRFDLADALPAADLLERIRKVKFENGAVVRAEVNRAQESLGKTITSRVEAAQGVEIPEEVTLSVPVFSNPGEGQRFPVRCLVDIDPEFGKFALRPFPDQVEQLRQRALASIADRLASGLKDVPFYYGEP